MDWFLNERDLCHERVNSFKVLNPVKSEIKITIYATTTAAVKR